MKIIKKILITFFIALIALFAYETLTVMYARSVTTKLFSIALKHKNIEIQLTDISKEQKSSLLLVEDPNFYKHNGIDFNTAGAGLTTITQAITKYLYFKKFSPGFKKIEQSLIAWLAVTSMVSKNDQLTVFINTAYLGTVEDKEVRGFAEAARVYYGKQFDELTSNEYLSIIAMLIAPKTFSVKYHSKQNFERVILIKKLLNGEYIPTGNRDVFYGQNT